MTAAVVVSVADFGLASVVAAPAVVSGLALIFAARAPAAAGLVFAFVLAVASGPSLTVVERAPAAVVFAAAEPAVAVASGLALIFFERALVAVAAFVLAAFHADRAFALFALPAVLAAHRPLC